jgi:hypothetical protein
MRYQAPVEKPRGALAGFATRASAPYWAALIGGILPGMVWSISNAFFLGCRDARRQAVIGIAGYGLVMGFGAAREWLRWSGALYQMFGRDASLADGVMFVVQVVAGLGLLRYLVGRQINLAAYRATLPGGLTWAFWLIVAMALFDYFVISYAVDHVSASIFWIWLPSLVI